MTKKIFLSIITVSFLAVTAAIFLLTGVSYRYAADTSAEHLRQSCTMIASAVEQSGGRYLDGLRRTSRDMDIRQGTRYF